MSQQDIEYVDVRPRLDHEPTTFYEKWVDQSSAKHANPELIAADALRKLYPGYSLVVSEDHRLGSLVALPGIRIHPSESEAAESWQLWNVAFQPRSNRTGGQVAGSLVDDVIVGSFKLTWNNKDFIVHTTKFHIANFIRTAHFILHDGPEQPARDLVLTACLYTEQLHDEVWVFNQGGWSKDKALWLEIQNSSWDDVVMKEESKRALQKDIHGFFKSEMTYKKLSIPWKRGLILYGPPGNGKTISIKAIMKACSERGFTPLYVKSFHCHRGEEGAMQAVFTQARQTAPCVLILEDLDSLITDRNRSFFLNQLDGLEGNDGLLVVATTNHFDRLDPGLSSRPSRFDRRYLFDDPDYQSRVLYASYWQEKLKVNDEISFPDSVVQEVADATQGFSFAYLKEAFVSALVRISNADVDEPISFAIALKGQVTTLRKELGEKSNVEHTSDKGDESSDTDLWPREVFCAHPSLPEVRPHLISSGASVTPTSQVRHAPPSAYPRVMPGSLPSTSMVPLNAQSHMHAPAWPRGRATGATNDVGSSQRHPFSTDTDRPRLVKMVNETVAK